MPDYDHPLLEEPLRETLGVVVFQDQVLEGGVRPDHQPDWDRLPHVSSDFGRFAEVGVDRRRGATRAAVIAELRDAIVRLMA